MAAVAMLAMNSCEKENEMSTGEQKGTPVEFEMGISASTRTATDNASRVTTWVEGDAVGIFAYAKGTTTSPVVTNAKYVLTGDKWVPAAGSEIYPEAAYDYYAYYPYQEGVTDPANISLAALADQTSADNYAKSDVLAAPKTEAEANATTVPLTFKHVYAMVEVQVNGDKVTKQPTSVILKGVKLGGTLNLTAADAPTVTATGNATDVTMLYLTKTENPNAAPFSFRAVVPAQEIAASTPLVTINDVDEAGTDYSMQYSAAVTYEAGNYRQIKVNIGTTKVSLEIPKADLQIDPWGESDAISGEGSEVVTPPQNLITLPFNGISSINAISLPKPQNEFTNEKETNWYSLTNSDKSPITTYTLDNDASEGKIIKVEYQKDGSWYDNAFIYYDVNTNNANKIDASKTYRLSFRAKTDIKPTDNNTSFWCYVKLPMLRKTVDDTTTTGFFCAKAEVQSAETLTTTPNMTCYNIQLTNEWTTYTCDFTFAYLGKTSGIGSNTTSDVVEEWKNVTERYSYYIAMAPRSTAGVYYIADITFEEVK